MAAWLCWLLKRLLLGAVVASWCRRERPVFSGPELLRMTVGRAREYRFGNGKGMHSGMSTM
jgi:hypothetical protein